MRGLAVVLVAAACHHPATTSAPPHNDGAPSPQVSGFVLVSQGAWLRAAASDEAEGGRATKLDGAPSDEANLEKVFVMRAIADEGDWITVANVTSADTESHCYGAISLDHFDLRLHVRKSDLLPVTTGEVDVSYADGSGFTLAAGVVVVPTAGGAQVGVDGFHPVVAVPSAQIGTGYVAPSHRLDDVPGKDELPAHDFTVDGHTLDINSVADNVSVTGDVATVRFACSLYRGVIVDNGLIGMSGLAGGYGIAGTGGIYDAPGIREDAPLFWPDGSPAGKTRDSIDVTWGAGKHAGMGCFLVSLATGLAWGDEPPPDDASLTLCARDEDWFAGYGG